MLDSDWGVIFMRACGRVVAVSSTAQIQFLNDLVIHALCGKTNH
jgi:hypothetical protein